MVSLLGGQHFFDQLSDTEKIIVNLSQEQLTSAYPFLRDVHWLHYKGDSKHHAKMNQECIAAGKSLFKYACLSGKLLDSTIFYMFLFYMFLYTNFIVYILRYIFFISFDPINSF